MEGKRDEGERERLKKYWLQDIFALREINKKIISWQLIISFVLPVFFF